MKLQGSTRALLVVGLLVAGCGSDDNNNVDLAGRWMLRSAILSNDCGLDDGDFFAQEANVTQTGNRVEIQVEGENPLTLVGSLSGSSMSLSGSLAQDDCAGGQTALSGNATVSDNSVTGTLQVDFTPSITSCAAGSRCRANGNLTMTRL